MRFMVKKAFLFIHGWAYDASFWDSYIQTYHADDTILLYDRGYFNNPHKPIITPDMQIHCVTHSMGLFFAFDEYDMSLFQSLTIYAGFETFPDLKGLKAMNLGMRRTPQKILDNFYQSCGYRPHISTELNYNLLQTDLKFLESFSLKNDPSWQSQTYSAFHGQNDLILKDRILKNARILEKTGHLCAIR